MINCTFYHDYLGKEIIDVFTSIMVKSEPCFVGRIGGSDFEVVNNYFNDKNSFIPENTAYESLRVRTLNGYFDFDNRHDVFIKYLERMGQCYREMEYCFYAGAFHIGSFSNLVKFNKTPADPFLYEILDGKIAMNYTFVEGLTGFLNSFKTWGEGKRILIVSPFSESLQYQYTRLPNILINYTFPNFDLVTYNTNITYNFFKDTKEFLGVNTNNWHEECDAISAGISKLDFDIALLSCGGYSMPVGNYIDKVMKRKAVYLGGILNVMFNIYGKRYDTTFFNSLVNREYQITSIENDKVFKAMDGNEFRTEAFNAYFGRKPNV